MVKVLLSEGSLLFQLLVEMPVSKPEKSAQNRPQNGKHVMLIRTWCIVFLQ